VQQLLWFEVFSKAAAGIVLVLLPLTAISAVGLFRPENGFWPRLLGSAVLGMAGAVFISISYPAAHGSLGPAGLIPINLAGAGALIAQLIMGSAAPTRRGKVVILISAAILLILAFLEIAHI
jgi:hypothetical protein